MTTHFIDNQRIKSRSGESISVLDPSDGQVFAHLARGNAEDIHKAVHRHGLWTRGRTILGRRHRYRSHQFHWQRQSRHDHRAKRSEAKRYIPVTLELGGKRPQIVFADANLDDAIPVIVNAIIQNAGQTCSAVPHLLVEANAYERVLEAVGQRIKALKVGPAAMDLDVGPLIRANQLEHVNGFLREAEKANPRTIAQGSIAAEAPATGFCAKPTLIADVPADAKLAHDEVVGPVLAAMSFKDEADAVRLANATEYGLVAGIWTENDGRAMRMVRAVKSGQFFINNYGAGGGVELPFGGVKSSG